MLFKGGKLFYGAPVKGGKLFYGTPVKGGKLFYGTPGRKTDRIIEAAFQSLTRTKKLYISSGGVKDF